MRFTRLTWGVKASFRAYVEGSGGTIAVSDGASRDASGAFVFPACPGGDLAVSVDGLATGALRFQGGVAFEAHGGLLKATLADLGVEVDGDSLVLTAAQTYDPSRRAVVAQLGSVQRAADGSMTLDAVITFDGMLLIADNYPPGTILDPVRLE
jgi:hypothetical protein